MSGSEKNNYNKLDMDAKVSKSRKNSKSSKDLSKEVMENMLNNFGKEFFTKPQDDRRNFAKFIQKQIEDASGKYIKSDDIIYNLLKIKETFLAEKKKLENTNETSEWPFYVLFESFGNVVQPEPPVLDKDRKKDKGPSSKSSSKDKSSKKLKGDSTESKKAVENGQQYEVKKQPSKRKKPSEDEYNSRKKQKCESSNADKKAEPKGTKESTIRDKKFDKDKEWKNSENAKEPLAFHDVQIETKEIHDPTAFVQAAEMTVPEAEKETKKIIKEYESTKFEQDLMRAVLYAKNSNTINELFVETDESGIPCSSSSKSSIKKKSSKKCKTDSSKRKRQSEDDQKRSGKKQKYNEVNEWKNSENATETSAINDQIQASKMANCDSEDDVIKMKDVAIKLEPDPTALNESFVETDESGTQQSLTHTPSYSPISQKGEACVKNETCPTNFLEDCKIDLRTKMKFYFGDWEEAKPMEIEETMSINGDAENEQHSEPELAVIEESVVEEVPVVAETSNKEVPNAAECDSTETPKPKQNKVNLFNSLEQMLMNSSNGSADIAHKMRWLYTIMHENSLYYKEIIFLDTQRAQMQAKILRNEQIYEKIVADILNKLINITNTD